MSDFKNKSEEIKPREKMLRASSPVVLTNIDLLAILLKTGTKDCDVLELSSRLLALKPDINEFIATASNWRTMKSAINNFNSGVVHRLVDALEREFASPITGLSAKEANDLFLKLKNLFVKESKQKRKNNFYEDPNSDKLYRPSFPKTLPDALFNGLGQKDYLRIKALIDEASRKTIKGVGQVKLLELAAAMELANRKVSVTPNSVTENQGDLLRINASDTVTSPPRTIKTPADATYFFYRALQGHAEQENFLVLPVNAKLAPVCDPILVGLGSLTTAEVSPREVFRLAIHWNAYSLFVAHNHPSGDPKPSNADISTTKRLIEISKTVTIPLLDHIIIGTEKRPYDFISMRQGNYVKF